MFTIEKHAEEIFWLQRRYDFLRMLNDVLEEGLTLQDAEKKAVQYSKVREPQDLVDRLKDIYGDDIH